MQFWFDEEDIFDQFTDYFGYKKEKRTVEEIQEMATALGEVVIAKEKQKQKEKEELFGDLAKQTGEIDEAHLQFVNAQKQCQEKQNEMNELNKATEPVPPEQNYPRKRP